MIQPRVDLRSAIILAAGLSLVTEANAQGEVDPNPDITANFLRLVDPTVRPDQATFYIRNEKEGDSVITLDCEGLADEADLVLTHLNLLAQTGTVLESSGITAKKGVAMTQEIYRALMNNGISSLEAFKKLAPLVRDLDDPYVRLDKLSEAADMAVQEGKKLGVIADTQEELDCASRQPRKKAVWAPA